VKKLCLICFALVLAGCGGGAFTRVESARVLVRDSMEVAAQGDWNRYTPNGARHREMWTQHGVPLDLLVYFTAWPTACRWTTWHSATRKRPGSMPA
jgi:hypothetical protein